MMALSDSALARWKKYLRADPTRWLLETGDPSILLWYQLDIAHRPEDARAVIETRERVLYSEPVQTIFAAQDELGFWGNAENLAAPYYTATLWNLALLAELGIPRTSRRARNACEFALQNFLREDGTFAGLNAVEGGYLIHALAYFKLARDARVVRAAKALVQAKGLNAEWSRLWAWRELGAQESFAADIALALERALNSLDAPEVVSGFTFPPFDLDDPLFILRVLAEYNRVHDSRAERLVEILLKQQDERGCFPLAESFQDWLLIQIETPRTASRWATLNALRVIVKLVMRQT
ncbi:MAG: hypothetical protein HY741_25735 [Chloroflexi bacterium]|nr:hypothetical protein [Chloroflexota bacterium]